MGAMFVNGLERNEQSLQRTFHGCFLTSFCSFGQAVQRRRLFLEIKQSEIKKNCLWWLCLLMDRDEMSNLYREPSIDASYQVSAHLAKGFQRRRLKCEKLRDDRQRTTDDGRKFNIISFKQILLPNNDKRIRHKFFSK